LRSIEHGGGNIVKIIAIAGCAKQQAQIASRPNGEESMQGAERALQQIAFGYVIMHSGKMRGMYNHEMIDLAREACDRLGIACSNGASEPFKPAERVSDTPA
jgi:hypothetical protein